MKYKPLLDLIKSSTKILVTSHLSPDPDAIGSSLFVYNILKQNFKDKEIVINIEGGIGQSLLFLEGSEDISGLILIDVLSSFKPDLLIITDANNLSRITKFPDDGYKYLKRSGTRVVIIDHHNAQDKDPAHLYIDNGASACAEEVYKIFYEDLSFELFPKYGESVLVGVLSDTGTFVYPEKPYRETFRVVADLIDNGYNLEEVLRKLVTFTRDQLLIIGELFKNTTLEEEYLYSYISDEYIKDVIIDKISDVSLKTAKSLYANTYLKGIEGREWGFIITRDIRRLDKYLYNGSFRASGNTVDTTVFTQKLGGDGHKLSSGFQIEAKDLNDAIKIVKQVIKDNLAKALKDGKAK